MKTAQKLHCSPWDIDDDERITPYLWHLRTLMALSCESEVQEWRNKRETKRRR